jgi:hypothetical protein
LLESALARPQYKLSHAAKPDWATLAAVYAFGLGKIMAFIAAGVFLGVNRYDLGCG